ncbi:MAG: protein kinase [Lachnospiraceae bacterium]|nr:protein kinase [Lachnospiraceae bacterium]
MGYVFISYSTKNQASADAMRELLKCKGIETWMAPGDIPPGSKYAQVINRAVKECACLLLMLSQDAQNSVWVAKEVERAVNYRKPVIPVRIEDVILNDEFELYISTDQVVAVQKIVQDSEDIKKLLRSVTAYTESGETVCEEAAVDQTEDRGLSAASEMPEKDLRPGSVIDGKYQIVSMLGSGIFARVYLAEHVITKKKWAVKIIENTEENFSRFAARVSVEISILNRLSHPGLPSIADMIQTDRYLMVVMDYIEGVPLSRVIAEQGAISEVRVIEWAGQLCGVLGYLHTQIPAIIHNDIHPRNIMLKSDGKISLIDFGTALEYSAYPDEDTARIGTTYYAAPEKYEGVIDKRTDIYALGMTLYALVIGKDPSQPPYAIYPIRQKNPHVSLGLEYIIGKCMERNPEDRYQDLREMQYDLDHIDKLSQKLARKRGIRRFFSR